MGLSRDKLAGGESGPPQAGPRSEDAAGHGEVVELDGPPCFDYGQKVRSRRTVRNDGTFPGKEIGEILIKKGEEGYVVSIGTFLQQFYIYGVDFVGRGYRVGMKARELEPVEAATAPDLRAGRTSEASRATFTARGPRLDPIGEAATGASMHRGPRLDPIGEAHDRAPAAEDS